MARILVNIVENYSHNTTFKRKNTQKSKEDNYILECEIP